VVFFPPGKERLASTGRAFVLWGQTENIGLWVYYRAGEAGILLAKLAYKKALARMVTSFVIDCMYLENIDAAF
jgi:hypothetical protein